MRTTVIALAAAAALTLAGCGGGEDSAEDASATPSATSAAATPNASASASASTSPGQSPAGSAGQGVRRDIVIRGDEVTPSAERVDVGTGERLALAVTSDRAGELHVHSSPEQELAFGRGTTVLDLVIDSPGIVEVEEHESGAVILRVYVS